MRVIRFLDNAGCTCCGFQHDDETVTLLDDDLYDTPRDTGTAATVAKLLAPLAPTCIIGIGLNYARHAREGNMSIPKYPVAFMKPSTALQNPGDPIMLPRHLRSDQVDYEGELAVVIGRSCRNVTPENALDYVLGYTCANDVSARDWQLQWGGSQWCRGKSFDTFAPLGPCLVTADQIPDPNHLKITTVLNKQVMQDWGTDDMIFDVRHLIAFLSGSTTLAAGTVILTGTPHGIGAARKPPVFLKAGDQITVTISGIGSLTNRVVEEPVGA